MNHEKVYSHDEAIKIAKEYFNNGLQADIFIGKYALRNNNDELLETSPNDLHKREARELSRIEEKKFNNPISYDDIYGYLKNFKKIIPQGSVAYGIGNKHKNVSLSNCYVLDSPLDSYSSILDTDEQLVQISKRRGGVGVDISFIRPAGFSTKNAARTSAGIIPFMERYSSSIREVGQNGRRGALLMSISVHHPEILEFATVKNNENKVNGANISIKLTNEFLNAVDQNQEYEQRFPVDSPNPIYKKMVRARDVWDTIINNAWLRAEPGLLFWDKIIDESPADCYAKNGFATISTNPCLSGDTLVYVADGRGNVPISQLANEGLDVDVFCHDNNGQINVRKMRNPRITGYNQPIYKVTLDDGSTIRVTKNHKFKLSNGEYREVCDLIPGDSLKIVTKYEASIKDVFPKANSRSQDYFWINNGQISTFCEHRIIAEFNYGEIPKGHIVHHKDRNAQNNHPSNLEIMSKEDHDELHSYDRIGDNNPMKRAKYEWNKEKWVEYRQKHSDNTIGNNNPRYSGLTHDDLKEKAIELTKKIGRRFSSDEWMQYAKENGLPIKFSKWRKESLGTLLDLSIWAAQQLNIENIEYDPRLVKTLQSAKSQGYHSKIIDKYVEVERYCEYCGNQFWVNFFKREISYCSIGCANKHRGAIEEYETYRCLRINEFHQERSEQTRIKQLGVYTKLKFDLGRTPMKKEWEAACKVAGIPFRLGSKYAFSGYKELQEKSETYNHRVVSVEPDGFENVYNGTVDDYHNFLVGGFEGTTKHNKKKWTYLVNRQCGELPLCALDSCRLLVLNLLAYVRNIFTSKAQFDYDEFYKDAQVAQRFMDNIIDLELEAIQGIINKIESDPEPEHIKYKELRLWKRIYEKCYQGRRTGLGITALGDVLAGLGIKYDTQAGIDTTEKIYKTLKLGSYRSSVDMAKELGPFPIWDWELEKNCPFLLRIKDEDPQLYDDMSKYGRRNISNLTTAPVGTISQLSWVGEIDDKYLYGTTSGIEPLFRDEPYKRRKKINPNDKNTRVDFVDDLGDKWQEYDVYHGGLSLWMHVTGETDYHKSPYYNSCCNDLEWKQRVKLQATAQCHVDHSISSTLNLPNNVTVDKVGEIYLAGWKEGVKGLTVYRDGCRTGVLIDKDKEEQKIIHTRAPKRPKKVIANIHHINGKNKPHTVLVGLLENHPYEVMVINKSIDHEYESGKIIKIKRGYYQLVDNNNNVICDNITDTCSESEDALTRMTSTALRHGANISFIVDQLQKVQGDMHSFAKCMSRALKHYIKDGQKVAGASCKECGGELIYSEGCSRCVSCGSSKCG